jgi:hypothetical protein
MEEREGFYNKRIFEDMKVRSITGDCLGAGLQRLDKATMINGNLTQLFSLSCL